MDNLNTHNPGLIYEVFPPGKAKWQKFRNNKNVKVNWQFTAENTRIKLSRLYPALEI